MRDLELELLEDRFTKLESILTALTEPKPSAAARLWQWSKPYRPLICLILGIIIGANLSCLLPPASCLLTPNTLTHQAATGGAAIPFPERTSLAAALERAADDLERGYDRRFVEERIRTAVAVSPTSGQWAEDFGKMVEAAVSADAVVYADNLRQIARGLK